MSAMGTSGAAGGGLANDYDLFSRKGIRAVGIDAVVAQSGVARQTL